MAKTSQTIRIKLGDRVRDLRKNLGMSQEELGEKADLHPTYVGGIERGERNVSLENLEKLSRALDLSLSELFDLPRTEESEEDKLRLRAKQFIASQDEPTLRLILELGKSLSEYREQLVRGKS